jgi:hypothetical protein
VEGQYIDPDLLKLKPWHPERLFPHSMVKMHFRLLCLILTFLVLTALVSSHPAAPLYPRQDSSDSRPPIAGVIATIKSSTGTDLTSNFQTLFYDGTAVEAVSNITDRQLPAIRPINFCRQYPANFYHSECTYRAGLRHSLQQYRVRCGVPNLWAGLLSERFTFEMVSFATPSPATLHLS